MKAFEKVLPQEFKNILVCDCGFAKSAKINVLCSNLVAKCRKKTKYGPRTTISKKIQLTHFPYLKLSDEFTFSGVYSSLNVVEPLPLRSNAVALVLIEIRSDHKGELADGR